MKQLSIDVVLLPPQEIQDTVIEWNQRLLETYPDRIRLGPSEGLPHISLAMACVRANDIPKLKDFLLPIAAASPALPLHIPGVKIVHNAAGEPISSFDIQPDRHLQALHESIVSGLPALISGPATPESMHNPLDVSASALNWINNFLSHSSFTSFWPHITLGYGQVERDFPARDFIASRLAVFHLGNHCTCQELLFEFGLTA